MFTRTLVLMFCIQNPVPLLLKLSESAVTYTTSATTETVAVSRGLLFYVQIAHVRSICRQFQVEHTYQVFDVRANVIVTGLQRVETLVDILP